MGIFTTDFLREVKMDKIIIDIKNLTKAFGDNVVLDDINLYIRENEFLTLLGPKN